MKLKGDSSGHVYRHIDRDAKAMVPRWRRLYDRLFHRKKLERIKDFID